MTTSLLLNITFAALVAGALAAAMWHIARLAPRASIVVTPRASTVVTTAASGRGAHTTGRSAAARLAPSATATSA